MGSILSRDEAAGVISSLKAGGKKIVFTNGCFDILHIGHARYLKEAKGLGDVLIVGVNADSSVGRLKPGRPIIGEAQRAEMLASLEAVDYVVLFSEDTPYELIRSLMPDVLVKGGDWKREDIVGSDIVPEVHSLPYISGNSTTEIIRKIVEQECPGK
ncbi:MAG: adenylyltransferase/cytidyltransferase family protein [Alphaproteobacteria bacterium]|uniref:Adenylyltransferase/cytidyltransferase family protein n=1 Tax=Candidatus Nitrobium versatile TaxID=2884831 RepID=A0A953JBH1_9BACT|nr:adenylyltransferase/cytidyltransferase family protein [Candidatus Nitrobium versatile]